MTVATTERKQSFTTNGVTVDFPFTFKATETNQIYCQYTPTGGETSDYTNFTVVLTESGGTVTTNDILSAGELLIYRVVPLTQNIDYVRGGRFPAESHETALDKLTLQNQDQQEELDRTIKNDIGDENPITLGGIFDYVDTGDAQTLQDANDYTNQKIAESEQGLDSRYVNITGDVMTGPLEVVAADKGTTAMQKQTISANIERAINTATGVLPDGTPKDYGFITEPVTEIIDLGGLS